ncbi:RHS repeat domain-containing protein [Tenacibaculum agarivorans]|uniref:RHS repeat domain-containing protein n=1 Tax=Tenacibaculum agarivorans TaxID=1908389 RepID=UPI00094B9DEA|nr:RHS repeat domain-containing protein [Tenacibaculum agarivorans]
MKLKKEHHLFLICALFICYNSFSQEREYGYDEPFKLFEKDKTRKFEKAPQSYDFIDYTGEGSVNKTNGKFELTVPFYTYSDEHIQLPFGINYSTSGVKMSEQLSTVGIDWDLVAGGEVRRIVKGMPDDLTSSANEGSRQSFNNAFTGREYRFPNSRGYVATNRGPNGAGLFDNHKYDKDTQMFSGIGHVGFFGSLRNNKATYYMYHFPRNRRMKTSNIKDTMEEFKYYSGRSENDMQRDIFKVRLGNIDFSFMLQEKEMHDGSNVDDYPGGGGKPYNGWHVYKAIPLDDKGYKIEFKVDNIPLFHRWYDTNKPNPYRSREITFDANGNPQSKSVNYHLKEGISGFIITDKKGVQYVFDKITYVDNEYLNTHIDNDYFLPIWNYPESGTKAMQWGMESSLTTSWKISKIVLPNKLEVLFEYYPVTYNHDVEVTRSHLGEYKGYNYNLEPLWHPEANGDFYVNKRVVTHELKRVVLPKAIIEFEYESSSSSNASRLDVKSSFNANLTRVKILDRITSNFVREFILKKDILKYSRDVHHKGHRMFLTSLTDSRKERSYTFAYDRPELLKRKNTAQFQDIWGYPLLDSKDAHPSFPKFYVANSNSAGYKIMYHRPENSDYFVFEGSDRFPIASETTLGTLKQVTFPTSGSLNIEYEPNMYYDVNTKEKNVVGPGVRVKKLSYNDEDGVSKIVKQYGYNLKTQSDKSSGNIMFRPSFAYIANHGYDNEIDRAQLENKNYTYYDNSLTIAYNKAKGLLKKGIDYGSSQSDQLYTTNQNYLLKKLIKTSNYPLGSNFDISGNEIIYNEVSERIMDPNSNNSMGEKRFFNHYEDNRTLVRMSGGNSDEYQTIEPNYVAESGILSITSHGNPWPLYKLSFGLMEIEGKDIYPFPDRSYFGTTGRFNGLTYKIEESNQSQEVVRKEEFEFDLSLPNAERKIKAITNNFQFTYVFEASTANGNQEYYDLWKTNGSYTNYRSPDYRELSLGVNFFTVKEMFPQTKVILKSKTTKVDNVESTQEYQYETTNLQVSKLQTRNSRGDLQEEELKYVFDLPYSASNQELMDKNITETPLKLISKNNGVTLGEKTTEYNIFPIESTLGTKVLPHKEIVSKGNNPDYENMIYDKYDDHDNLLEYHRPGGIYTSILWGFDKEYPLAKVEGVKYDEMIAVFSSVELSALNDNSNVNALRNILNKLRGHFPKALITTYTLDPLIGLTSITDPRGNTTYFEYDIFDRLKAVKDFEGNVIEDYNYKFKN